MRQVKTRLKELENRVWPHYTSVEARVGPHDTSVEARVGLLIPVLKHAPGLLIPEFKLDLLHWSTLFSMKIHLRQMKEGSLNSKHGSCQDNRCYCCFICSCIYM